MCWDNGRGIYFSRSNCINCEMVKIGANVQNNSNKFLLDESFGDIMRKDIIDRTPIILKYLWQMKVFKGMLHFVIIYFFSFFL